MTLVMGILNVTPDSFSDGGEFLEPQKAIARGLEMFEEGATIIDVGGESTKPGAERVTLEEELTRVIPVVHALAKAGVKVSVDTMRAETAAMAVAAGASIINDVSGGLADPAMHATAAALKVQYICMHWRGQSKNMPLRVAKRMWRFSFQVSSGVFWPWIRIVEAIFSSCFSSSRLAIERPLLAREPSGISNTRST